MKHAVRYTVIAAAVSALGLTALPAVQAHEAGDIIVRTGAVGARLMSETMSFYEEDTFGGVTDIYSGKLKKNNVQAALSATYMVTDNVGVEFMLTSPFSHKFTGRDDEYGFVGQYGKVKQLPLTLNALYFPMEKRAAFQPYVGGGINYTLASFKINGAYNDAAVAAGDPPLTDGEVEDAYGIKNRFGLNLIVGADYSLTKNWLLNAQMRYAYTPGNKGTDGEHMAKGTLYYMVGIGYKF